MINTVQTQREQLRNGLFRTGSGPKVILLLGSCRTLSYLNYLHDWNQRSGNQLTIYRIDPTDWHWNESGDVVDFEAKIKACESDQRILDVLKSAEIYVHEYYGWYGMFNSSKDWAKNIYQFGLDPKIDVCLPNFHDRFVLFNDQVQFDQALRDNIKASGMTPDLERQIVVRGLAALDKFYGICALSNFPEMADHFKEWWTKKRFFWTGNHVSRHFTLYLFRELNEKYLLLPFDDAYWQSIDSLDIFARPCTAVTQHDVDGYGLSWPDPIEPLKV